MRLGEEGKDASPQGRRQRRAFHSWKHGREYRSTPGRTLPAGNNQPWKGFAEHYCGNPDNDVSIATSWLLVGHSDEISVVLPTEETEGRKAPCNFSIGLASPSKALELMKQDPQAPFFDFVTNGKSNSSTDAATYRVDRASLSGFCSEADKALKALAPPARPADSPQAPNGRPAGKAASLRFWQELLGIRSAEARVILADVDPSFECSKLTNSQVISIWEKLDRIRTINSLIQISMNEAKETIAAKLAQRLPQCKPTFVELPNLFWTHASPVEVKDAPADAPLEKRFQLPETSVVALNPSPTNLVVTEKGIIYSDPQNATFRKYLDDEIRKLGKIPQSMDTFDYAHEGQGNLHCTTHSMRMCRPPAGVPVEPAKPPFWKQLFRGSDSP